MAKFCGNCGTQLEDSANVCGYCGTPCGGAPAHIPGLNVTDPAKRKKQKKIAILIASIVAFAIVAVIGVNVVLQHTGYNGLLRKTMDAYMNYDMNAIVSLASDVYYSDDEDWIETNFQRTINENLEYFESSVGHSYKLSYDVNEIYPIPEYKMDEVLDQIEYVFPNFDVSTLEEIVVADVTVTARQGSLSDDQHISVGMSKEDGKWKLLYIQ